MRPCTPEMFYAAVDAPATTAVCAAIEDALERVRRGEMTRDDFETYKAEQKRRLPAITPHATFTGGRRRNSEAVPSGLAMYDIDHIADPRGYFAANVEQRTDELGIALAHVTPSTEGLRLVFAVPPGMEPDQAQRWMSRMLGDDNYDGCVKDMARCSFLVPRSYILYVNDDRLFRERSEGERSKGVEVVRSEGGSSKGGSSEGERSKGGSSKGVEEVSSKQTDAPLTFKGVPYADIIGEWWRLAGGEPQQGERNDTPPEMPRRLPALIALLVSRTPDIYKAAVAHAVFPPLAAHLWRVRFRYVDNVEHEATLMNVLMAGTGAGKDCISAPVNRIMADIRRRDAENLRREREWKNEINSKGANKDKRQRPEGLVIQEIDADMTNPAFVMRTAEADGHFLYTKLNEIDQFDSLKGSGRSGQQFQIMCLAFDPGNRYGQTRVGTQSVTEKVTIRFNWNAATTIQKGRRYFSGVLTDGPVSRINFCTIPEREIGSPIPVYGTYDDAFDEKLRPYIENLTNATGLIECRRAERLARRLLEENADTARLTQSRVYENLSFRATVIAWLKACVLYVANGCRWDKATDDFIRWSLRYDMWCKMAFFGEDIAKAMSSDNMPKHGPRNLLSLLPDYFTLTDAADIRLANGKDSDGTHNMLNQWVHRGYIRNIGDGKYEKAITDDR